MNNKNDVAIASAPGLQRALGRWDLTAFGVNIVIGGGVFLTPSLVAAQLGNWSPTAVIVVGLAVLCIALSYAEVGSRFDSTGGPYLYTLAAFGRFVAFEVGWMSWFTRVASIAALVHGIALAVGYYAPAVSAGIPRVALMIGVILGVAFINARGIRQSTLFIDGITIAKLVPLAIFIAVGLFFVDWTRLSPLPSLGASEIGTGALLLIYSYGGYEVMGVPAGETRHPRTDLAFAMVTTVASCAVIYVLAQIITMTVLPDVTQSKTPIADSAAIFLGPAGALMVGIGSLIAITGNVTGRAVVKPVGKIGLVFVGDERGLDFLFAPLGQRSELGIRDLAGNQLGREFGRTFHQGPLKHRGMLVIDESRHLLDVGIFVRDHVHKPVLDVGIEPVRRAKSLEADLDAGGGASHAHGLSPADGYGYGRESRLRIETAQCAQRDLQALTHAGQDDPATLGIRVNFRTLGQGFGDPRPGDVSHLGELVQTVRTRIDVVVLELIGGRGMYSSPSTHDRVRKV